MPEKLSVVIITFNEEDNIERCLKSVEGLADEIVVLDSFSTDKTESVCKSFGVKFYRQKFKGYIEQKNDVLKYASNNWVLSLDADEVLSNTLFTEIKKTMENPDADVYGFNRLNNYCGKWIRHSGWYPDKKLRLWKKEKGKWGGINPHDKLMTEKDAVIKYLKGDLLHYSYKTIDEHIAQINKFSTIAAIEAHKNGKKSNVTTILIRSFWKFVRNYFLKSGFLDGYYGFIVCSLTGWETFVKYVKLKELNSYEKK